MSVHEALLAVGDTDADPVARRDAWIRLRTDLPGVLKRYVWKSLEDDQDLLAGLVDHVIEKAASPGSRYRGEHGEPSAQRWVKTIVRNKLISRQRSDARRALLAAQMAERSEQEGREAASAESQRRHLVTVCSALGPACLRQMATSASEWNGHVKLVFEAVFRPGSTEAILRERRYLTVASPDAAEFKRARAQYHQHVHRGRHRLAELLQLALASPGSAFGDDDVTLFVRMHRLPWPPPARPSTRPSERN